MKTENEKKALCDLETLMLGNELLVPGTNEAQIMKIVAAIGQLIDVKIEEHLQSAYHVTDFEDRA